MKLKLKKLISEFYDDSGITIQSIEEIRDILLNHTDVAFRTSMGYYIATYKIKELQADVISAMCRYENKGYLSTLIYASYQFECSKYFKVYIAIMLESTFHSSLESYIAIRKCKNISVEELSVAKKALEYWCYFHDVAELSDSEVISKKELITEIITYLKGRIKRMNAKLNNGKSWIKSCNR